MNEPRIKWLGPVLYRVLSNAPYASYPTLRIANVTDDGDEDDYAASACNSSRTAAGYTGYFAPVINTEKQEERT